MNTPDRRSIYKQDFMRLAAGLILLFLLVLTTNPQSASMFLLLLVPVIIFTVSFSAARPCLLFFMNLNMNKARELAVCLASAPTLLFLLGTIGHLSTQDVLLVLCFAFGLAWYFRRIKIGKEIV